MIFFLNFILLFLLQPLTEKRVKIRKAKFAVVNQKSLNVINLLENLSRFLNFCYFLFKENRKYKKKVVVMRETYLKLKDKIEKFFPFLQQKKNTKIQFKFNSAKKL